MDGLRLLREAQAAGLTVRADGERLIVRGPRRAEPVALRLLANKVAILSALRGATGDTRPRAADTLPPHWRELYEERAAIMEFDANMTRADAEHFALAEILKRMRECAG